MGRVYRSRRRIRLSDTTAAGRLRLDAAARYAQDIASDDVDDAGIDDGGRVWVVRRAAFDVVVPFGEDRFADVATWSGGLGPRWAGRRTTIAGDGGGRIEGETLWAYIDRETQRLARLPEAYSAVYGASPPAPSPRLELPRDPAAGAARRPWPLRISDVDILGHVNNAVHWAAVEALLAEAGGADRRLRAMVEYRDALDVEDPVELAVEQGAGRVRAWFVTRDTVAAALQVDWDGQA